MGLEAVLAGLQLARPILRQEVMARHTSFKVGGPADYLVQPSSAGEVAELLQLAESYHLPLTIMGRGSNLLVRDGGIRGLVLKLAEGLQDWSLDREAGLLRCGAGLSLAAASHLVADLGFSGLEFACGIPGSLGGAVYMNAGAFGGEISEVVTQVAGLDRQGVERVLSREELGFSYRRSVLMEGELCLTQVSLQLQPRAKEDIWAAMERIKAQRQAVQPVGEASAGSTFKRPQGAFAAALIDRAGLKGASVGGAQVSTKHAGFIINKGGATAQDVLDLMAFVEEKVWQLFQVRLEPEVKIIGEG